MDLEVLRQTFKTAEDESFSELLNLGWGWVGGNP